MLLHQLARGIDRDLVPYCFGAPFGEMVERLSANRGVKAIGGLCLAAEVFDRRRFPSGNVKLIWPHCDHPNRPHLCEAPVRFA